MHDKMDAIEAEIMGRHVKFTVDPRWPALKSEISMVRDPATKKVFAKAVKGTDGKLTWGPPR